MPGQPIRRARNGQKAPLASRPPFECGNLVARKHGVFRPEELRPIAESLAAELVEVAPWTSAPAFTATVARWAWAEAACRAYRAWFAEHGLFDGDEPRTGQDRWARFEATAARAAEVLGLSPLALAKLLGTLAGVAVAGHDDDGLEELKRAGAEILAARGLAPALEDGVA
jgi:hypothetical protein